MRGEAEKVRAGVGEIVGAATYYFDQYRIMILNNSNAVFEFSICF